MGIDLFINTKITLLQTELFTKVMILITNLMSPEVLAVFTIFLLALLLYKKKPKQAFFVFFAIGGAAVLELTLKELIQRARPENALIDASSTYSFPSGHATLAITFFSLLIYLYKDHIKDKILRYIFIGGNIGMIFLIGFSRIYLNVHWFSDVLGGFAIGMLWLGSLIFFFERKNKRAKHS